MLVSIVINNYNYGVYLADAIDSALAQDYSAREIIVVDDGSTDDSVQIIERYGSAILPVLKSNGGQPSVFNAGFKKCSGDLVVFLDSDDVLLPDAVSRHVACHQDRDIVRSCGYLLTADERLDSLGGRVPARLTPPGDYRARFAEVGPLAYRPAFTSGNAWSRAFLEQALPLPLDNSLGADGYLTAIDLLYGPVDVLDAPVGKYRIHRRNKGPINYRFNTSFLKRRVESCELRLSFAAKRARGMGVSVDLARWRRRRGWKMALAAHTLHRMGESTVASSRRELFLAALHTPRSAGPPRALLAAMVLVVSLLPRVALLRVSAYLLGKTWGKDRAQAFGDNREWEWSR